MKHVISSLAIVTSLLGAGACTVDDESPDLDLATLELRSDFEVIIVEPATDRGPRLADSDLQAKASPSFADDHFVGGAGSAHEVPASGDARPTFPGYELGFDRDLPTYEGHELGSETGQPQPLDDPCTCTGEACLRSWVEANIGCDVCAVFVCDGALGPHACNSCN
ncbi:MAG TPA: hypothetical protein VNB06_00105 [Thermoanaerobaculia bacterium]|nr:hypothetical protein [Thermoanaerobaculia bacterium]